MEIMNYRHGHNFTVVISQLPTNKWYDSIDEITLADAILNRIIQNARRLPLKGASMRNCLDQLTEDEHLA